jgi:hypothetical protein
MALTLEQVWRAAYDYFNKRNARRAVKKIANGYTVCAYRTPGGNCCAIGVSIPDSLYDPAMEGKTIEALIRQFEELESIFGEINFGSLANLQYCHDGASNVKEVRKNLKEFGISHGFISE